MVVASQISPLLDTSSLTDLLGGFLLGRQVEGCALRTIGIYQFHISQFLRFADGSSAGVGRTDVERYLLALKERGCSPAYIRSNFCSLRAFFNWCVAEELIPASPIRNMKPPRLPKVAKGFITEAQRDALLKFCPPNIFLGARNAAVVWLFWSTGARLSEILGLKLLDLDWDGSRIRVFGKGARERYVPFTKEAKKAVWKYLRHRRDSHPHLWVSEERRPLGASGMAAIIRRLLEGADMRHDVKDLHHVFRRSWAMRNLRAGIPIKFVQLVGGWESISTLEGYVRAMQSDEAMGANWV